MAAKQFEQGHVLTVDDPERHVQSQWSAYKDKRGAMRWKFLGEVPSA